MKKTFFYSCCLLRVAFCFLCVEKQDVLLVFNLVSLLLTPLKRFRVAFSLFVCGSEPGLEPGFSNVGLNLGLNLGLNPGCNPG